MAGKLGKFQVTPSFTTWGPGITRKNHLGSIFQTAPQKASELMVQLLASNKGKSLESFLAKFPTKTFETDDEYTWNIVGSHRRNIPLLEARNENGAAITDETVLGAGGKPFYLVFAEDWFADGEVITGNKNEIYPLRILGDARMEGSNAVYKVELMGGVLEGMPVEELVAGTKFSVDYAPVEDDMSREVGGVRFSSPSQMRNEFSKIRIKHKVGGAMLNRKVACGIPVVQDGKKRVETMWMHYVDYEVEQQFSEYKNNILAFGRSNRNTNGEYLNVGKSGGVIKMGAGLYEQMEYANTFYYSNFSLKLLEDALMDICTSNLGMGERNFIIMTGERGAMQFHKAVANSVNGWGMWQLNADALGVVNKTTSELNNTALAAGFQFTEYRMPNSMKVTVKVDPYYDDPVRNKVMHPLGGPAFSYRYDIFDMGTMDQPNIFKCVSKNDPEMRGYQWGIRNPFTGQMNNPYMSFDEDAAVIHKMATLGICVLDPTRTLSLIPNILGA